MAIQRAYTDGIIRISSGSREVRGEGTAFALRLVNGGLLSFGGRCIPIASVESDTRLTLEYPSPGAFEGIYAIDLHTAEAVSALAAWRRLTGLLEGLNGMSALGRSLTAAETAEAMRGVLQFDPALFARLTGSIFTGDVEVQGAGRGVRHHIPGVFQGVWRLTDDGRLVWFIGDSTPMLTIFPSGDLYLHGPNYGVADAFSKRLRVDVDQGLSGAQQLQVLRNTGATDYWSGLRGASSAANLRSAIDVDRTRQAIYANGGDEQNGLADAPTVRLNTDFVARASTAFVEGAGSFRAMTSALRYAYGFIRIVDLSAGAIRGSTPEQVVSLEANAVDRYYGFSRSLAVQNLTVGNTHRVELMLRGSLNNVAAPQGMIISGVN